jgi:hypothetical protein
MTPNDFCFWLNGYLEMSGAESIDKAQTDILKDHLKLVFEKKTPNYSYGAISLNDFKPYSACTDSPIASC